MYFVSFDFTNPPFQFIWLSFFLSTCSGPGQSQHSWESWDSNRTFKFHFFPRSCTPYGKSSSALLFLVLVELGRWGGISSGLAASPATLPSPQQDHRSSYPQWAHASSPLTFSICWGPHWTKHYRVLGAQR